MNASNWSGMHSILEPPMSSNYVPTSCYAGALIGLDRRISRAYVLSVSNRIFECVDRLGLHLLNGVRLQRRSRAIDVPVDPNYRSSDSPPDHKNFVRSSPPEEVASPGPKIAIVRRIPVYSRYPSARPHCRRLISIRLSRFDTRPGQSIWHTASSGQQTIRKNHYVR